MKLIPACDLSPVSLSLSSPQSYYTACPAAAAVYLLFIHARIPLMHWGREEEKEDGGEQWKKVEATTIPLPR